MRRLSHGEGPPADGSPDGTRRNSTGERRNSTGEPRRTRSVFATRLQGARMQISVLRPSQAFNSDSEVVKWAVSLLPATAGGATLACLLEVGDDGVALRDDEGTLGTFRIDELSLPLPLGGVAGCTGTQVVHSSVPCLGQEMV